MKTLVTAELDRLGLPYRLKFHAVQVYTSEAAAQNRGLRLSQIVKTMLLAGAKGEIIVAVLPGHLRLDLRKVKRLTGDKDLRFLDRATLAERFGLTAGAIAPVGEWLEGRTVLVDPAVFAEEVVDISSGDPSAGVELLSTDLKKLFVGAEIVEISQGGGNSEE